LRKGEALALVGAMGLAAVLPVRWYELRTPIATVGQSETGFGALGWPAVLILLIAVLSGIALAVLTASQRATALPVALGVVAAAFAILAVLTIVLRLVFRPGLGVGAPDEEVALQPGAWAGLAFALVLAAGAWIAMGDERTGSRDAREQTEAALAPRGAPRPAPPPNAT
jgi:DMSO/TMAO reductase YedYZ heme-binding membrane subunit